MPVTNIGSYPTTMQEFIDHWTPVNALLGTAPLILKGPYTLANFTTDRLAVVNAINAIIAADNTRQGAAATRDLLKAALRIRLQQFRAAVLGLLSDTKYVPMLPTIPQVGAVESRYLAPFTDMADLWSKINADTIAGFTGPLLLAGAYTLVNFNTDLAALRAAYITLSTASKNAENARADRDLLLRPALLHMKQYRQTAVARLPAGSSLLSTVPALTTNPGPPAQPVNATIHWDKALKMAVIEWTPSASQDVQEYSIRLSPGDHYDTRNEAVLESVGPTVFRFATDKGLIAPGSTILLRVYTVTRSGRERGSRTLQLTRPDE